MDKPKGTGNLVLTVKEDMMVTIGTEIQIRVYKENGSIRMAINAPRSMNIQRLNAEKRPEKL